MKDISKLPPKPRLAANEIKPVKRAEILTLAKLFTKDQAENHLVKYLKDLSDKKGPWQKYWAFYQMNHTGDISSMNKENRAFAEKMCEDVRKKYEEEMI